MDHDKRQFLALISSAVFVFGDKAFAQSLSKNPQIDVQSAADLSDLAIKAQSDNEVSVYIAQQLHVRRKAAADAEKSGMFKDEQTANAYLKGIDRATLRYDLRYYDPENYILAQIEAISLVSSMVVRLIPDTSSIQPIGIPVIEPAKNKSADSDIKVAFDILIQTIIGISLNDEQLYELIKEVNLEATMAEFLSYVKQNKLIDALNVAIKLFRLLMKTVRVKILLGKMGEKIAFRIVIELTTVIGWAIDAANFLVAVKVNYHRFSFAK